MVLNSKGEELFSNHPTHPGDILGDELETRAVTRLELSRQIGVSATFVSELVRGKKSVSVAVALKLENALGINASFWLNGQVQYNRNLAYLKAKREMKRLNVPEDKQKELLKAITA